MHNSSLIGTTSAAYSGGDKPEYTQAQIRVLHNISITNILWSFFLIIKSLSMYIYTHITYIRIYIYTQPHVTPSFRVPNILDR